jgi:hypothetical protein
MEQVTVTPDDIVENPNAEQEANKAALDRLNSGKSSFGHTQEETPADPPGGPIEIPDKFKNADGTPNVEALLKSYSHLESKLSGGDPKVDPEVDPEAPKVDPETPDLTLKGQKAPGEEAAEEAVEQAGLNMADLSTHFQEHGELSEEHYEAFEKAGIQKEYVDGYIEGQKALVHLRNTDILTKAGGHDQYNEMCKWALDVYTQEQQDTFDKAIATGGPAEYEIAIKALKADYVAANGTGSPATRVKGQPAATTSDAFQSKREQISAMADPRYSGSDMQRDPAYIAEVARRTAAMVRNRG